MKCVLYIFCYSPDEMYYFAPKSPQNNKSSIVGQRLDVTIFEDFLNTAPVREIKLKYLIYIYIY